MISWDDWLAEEVDPLLKLAQRASKLAARGGVPTPSPMPSSTVPTVIFPYRSIFPRDPSPRSSPIRVRKYANTRVPHNKRRWPGTAIVPVF